LSKVLLHTALEDHAPTSNTRAATTTVVTIRSVAQSTPVAVNAAQFAKLAAGGFFGVAAVRVNKRTALKELRKAVEKVRELDALAAKHSPLFGEWKPPEGAREAGKALIAKAVAYVRHKGLDKGAEGKFVKVTATPRGDEATESRAVTFDALGDEKVARAAGEAALAIWRVVEEAGIVVRPVVAIASRALVEVEKRLAEEPNWERLVEVGLADDEFKRAFNVAGRPLYFVYSVGDVEFGAVRARGVRAVAFVSGAKTLRIEVLAEGVEGLAAERVKALGGEWLRLATFQIETETGVVQLVPRVEVSASVEVEPALAKQLSALVLTDAGKGGRYLGSPDPALHLFYALAVGEAEVRAARVVFTVVGPTLQLESRAPPERVNWLYKEVRRELEKLGVKVEVWKHRRMAKSVAVEIIGEYAGEVMRIAREARSVEEPRARLVELFDRVMREAAEEYWRTGSKEALRRAVGAIVAKRFFAENVDDPVWWALLLLGDGIVNVRNHIIGFAAKPAEAAEAVMYVFARVMGVPLEVKREGEKAILSREASRAAVEKLFRQLKDARMGSVHQLLAAVADWWLRVGTGGSRPPKLISLLTSRELVSGEVGKWLKAWLSYETAVTPVTEVVEHWLNGVYRVFVKPPRDTLIDAVSFYVYFEHDGKRFKLHTDFSVFRLSCESCGEGAKGVLATVAKALGVELRWEGNALDLPADVGWAILLRLWHKYDMSLPIVKGGKELLRVEVLEARADGTAKFRLWYHEWQEIRPDRPYVDIELTYKGKGIGFRDLVSANAAEGILKKHLAEIAELLRNKGVEGVAYYEYEKSVYLQFTGAFRDSVLARLGIRPELPPGEPAEVRYLGGLKFRVSGREMEFREKAMGARREFYAELKFSTREEAERLVSSLRAIGVDARVVGSEEVGYMVRLDSDSFFGLLAATNAAPPGLTPLYRSKEGDFRVYAAMEGGRMRFYFAVRHEGVWRAVEGLYDERGKAVELWRKEREVLEAVRDAVTKALEKLGRSAEVGEPKEERDKEGKVVGYSLRLYGPHVTPFLEHAAEHVEAGPADVRLEGRRIVVRAGGVETALEFKLLKLHKAEHLTATDVVQTLALYKSLKEVGVPVEITPKGVRVDGEAMWALVAAAVEGGAPSGLPAEVMPGVELLKIYSASGMRIYTFRVSEEGIHYYFAVKTEQGWRAAGGKYVERQVQIAGETARTVAEAIFAIYSEMKVERRIEVKQLKDGTPYIRLTNVDLELLGLNPSG